MLAYAYQARVQAHVVLAVAWRRRAGRYIPHRSW